jgi:hypothetical protein
MYRMTQTENMRVIIIPGMTPAMKSFPTEVWVAIPYTIMVTLGGIRIPRVPPPTIRPVARDPG